MTRCLVFASPGFASVFFFFFFGGGPFLSAFWGICVYWLLKQIQVLYGVCVVSYFL